jgi:hypothetical protein
MASSTPDRTLQGEHKPQPPPPDLISGWRGGSSVSCASRYATWLLGRMPEGG